MLGLRGGAGAGVGGCRQFRKKGGPGLGLMLPPLGSCCLSGQTARPLGAGSCYGGRPSIRSVCTDTVTESPGAGLLGPQACHLHALQWLPEHKGTRSKLGPEERPLSKGAYHRLLGPG